MESIYLDNAATSWPKPPQVLEAIGACMRDAGGNPGRAAHRLANEAARVVFDAREAVATLFCVKDPLRVAFGPNVTWALNTAIRGILKPGDHAICTAVEHNALMRPLRAMEQSGIGLTVVPCTQHGEVELDAWRAAFTPRTRLAAFTHASNVTGAILPLAPMAGIARDAGALVLVDTAQSAGCVAIDMESMSIDLLAFTGHKGLQGPTGTGGLIIGPRVDSAAMEPLTRGGTGSQSELEVQPSFLPDRFESGTPNVCGLAGLGAGVSWVLAQGVDTIAVRESELRGLLVDGLTRLRGVRILGLREPSRVTATVSVLVEAHSVTELASELDDRFGVMVRAGLHCAPACHRTIGTHPHGTLRLSIGAHTTIRDIEIALEALGSLVGVR